MAQRVIENSVTGSRDVSTPLLSGSTAVNKKPAIQLSSRKWWGGKPPAWGLYTIALAVSLLMVVPLLYLLVRTVTASPETWERLWSRRIPTLLFNTLSLTLLVTLSTLVLGVGLAWLIARTNLPGHRWLGWLLAMPLAVPPYIAATLYITVFDHKGLAEQYSFGLYDLQAGQSAWIFGFWGSFFVLTLFTYPYVYLNALAAFRRSHRSLDEAARGLGMNRWQIFRRVHLPLVRPAASAGALMVAFYMLSEFGVVSLLRYETFTIAIFRQLSSRNDNSAAAILSGVLVIMTLVIMWAEHRAQGKAGFAQVSNSWKPLPRIELGGWKLPALLLVWATVFLGLLLPVFTLFYWLGQELNTGKINLNILWGYSFNSAWSALLAATLAVLLSLPLAYLVARYRSQLVKIPAILSTAGYALPGVVVALSVVFLFNNWLPWLYGTLAALIIAYVVRFLPLTLHASQAAIKQITPSLEEAGHSLGMSRIGVFRRILVPLSSPGILAGWGLFFLTVVRELPATLVLRPVGYDTLPVRVWMEASEGFYGRASLPALVLIAISAFPLFFIITRHRGGSHLGI
jgi:iron(III) transport system permease protein